MIIVEGPDGSGKSTLVEQLSLLAGARIMPKAVSADMTITTPIDKYVAEALDLGFSRRIYDRFALISAPIYTAMTHKIVPQPGFGDYRWMSREYARMREVAPLVIICLPSLETVWANCQRDEANKKIFLNKGYCACVYWLYFNLAARNPAHILYNYEVDRVGQVYDSVERVLQNRGQ